MMVVEPPDVTLARWKASGQLQPKSWVARLDETISSRIVNVDVAKLDVYCTTTQNGEPCLQQSGLRAILQQFVPDPAGTKALDAAIPVLWKIFTYISRYPFLLTPTLLDGSSIPQTMTRPEFLRALVLLHSELSDRLFNGDNDTRTRCRTNADQRRLLFQALSSPRRPSPMPRPPHDEALWTRGAALRAARYWPTHRVGLQAVRMPYNMRVNRDTDGDECFHDLLDFMCALLPEDDRAIVSREDCMSIAREMAAGQEVVVTRLQDLRMARGDFEALVEFLLVMYFEGCEDDLKELPLDFMPRKDRLVAAFFGDMDGKNETDFLEFDEALSAATSEIMGGEDLVTNEFSNLLDALEWVVDTYILSLLKLD